MKNLSHFFETARERYTIKLRRERGQEAPWTDDPVFQKWRFCNVHREDDKTTQWFREHIRDPLSDDPRKVLLATVAFRWFNRIETGELIKDELLSGWPLPEAEDSARGKLGSVSPLTTSAYIIKSPTGLSKLEGLLQCIRNVVEGEDVVHPWPRIQDLWEHLQQYPLMGPFMAYEVVSDLRWTSVLHDARDILSWANPGPGCARGLGWMFEDNPSKFKAGRPHDRRAMLGAMSLLLTASRSSRHWPMDWPRWEMREVEHWACEYDKYRRGEAGQNLKRRYH